VEIPIKIIKNTTAYMLMHIQYPTVIILSAIFFVFMLFIIIHIPLYNKSNQDTIGYNDRNNNTIQISWHLFARL
jgi:hypothetical protein